MPVIIQRIYHSVVSIALKRTRILLAIGVVGTILAFVTCDAASFLATPGGMPKRANCIVVLGGDSGDRIVKALELYRNGYAREFLITGVPDS